MLDLVGYDPGSISPHEAFLAAGIGATTVCSLVSVFLRGRVAERMHVALAMLVVLIAAFCLFTLFGMVGQKYPPAGAAVLLGLIALFKLMNQFEIHPYLDK
jgi:hypothetical protein